MGENGLGPGSSGAALGCQVSFFRSRNGSPAAVPKTARRKRMALFRSSFVAESAPLQRAATTEKVSSIRLRCAESSSKLGTSEEGFSAAESSRSKSPSEEAAFAVPVSSTATASFTAAVGEWSGFVGPATVLLRLSANSPPLSSSPQRTFTASSDRLRLATSARSPPRPIPLRWISSRVW